MSTLGSTELRYADRAGFASLSLLRSFPVNENHRLGGQSLSEATGYRLGRLAPWPAH
jgi:hypothetical protein